MVGMIEQIKALQLYKFYPWVQLRVRWTTNHRDAMPQVGKSSRQIPQVNSLATAVWITTIAQQSDA